MPFWVLLVGPDPGLIVAGVAPWPLLGWLIHIVADRALGFGLRGPEGGQALI